MPSIRVESFYYPDIDKKYSTPNKSILNKECFRAAICIVKNRKLG